MRSRRQKMHPTLKPEDQFNFSRYLPIHRRFYLHIKLLSSYADQPSHIFQLARGSTVKTLGRNLTYV